MLRLLSPQEAGSAQRAGAKMTPPAPHNAETACTARSLHGLQSPLSLYLLSLLPPLTADAQSSSPQIIEWQLPRPMYARSSATAPDGML